MMKQSVGILGCGDLGAALARLLVRAGQSVWLANSRGPDSLLPFAAELGRSAHAATVAEAVGCADLTLLAVPWAARGAAVRAAGGPNAFAGKIAVDALNPYTQYPLVEELGACASSEVVAMTLGPSARLVKAFNSIRAEVLASGSRPGLPPDERLAIPLCGDDMEAKGLVSALILAIGFAPVDIGSLNLSRLQEPHHSLYNVDFTPPEMRLELARYKRGQESN